MFVQRVLSSIGAVESWTVLGEDGAPVTPVTSVRFAPLEDTCR